MSSVSCLICCSIVVSLAVGSMGQNCPTAFNDSSVQDPPAEVRRSLKLWQGVILIVCFGVLGILVATVHRLIRYLQRILNSIQFNYFISYTNRYSSDNGCRNS